MYAYNLFIPRSVLLGSLRIFSKSPGIEGMILLIFLILYLSKLATKSQKQ